MPTRLPPQHTLRLYLAAPDCAAPRADGCDGKTSDTGLQNHRRAR